MIKQGHGPHNNNFIILMPSLLHTVTESYRAVFYTMGVMGQIRLAF